MRNLLSYAGRQGRRVVSAFVATAFAQDDAAAKAQWRQVADQPRPKAKQLATIMDEAEEDVPAYMTFPKEHRTKLHSTTPLERLNGEIKRRTNAVGLRGLTPPSATVLLASERGRRDPPRRCHPPGTERRMGRPAGPLHEAGNDARARR